MDDDPEPERRGCDSRDGDRAHHMVDPAVLPQCRDGAERDRDQDGDHGRHHGDLQRDRQARRDLLGDRLARPHRDPEVEAKEAPGEVQELEHQWTIEPELGVTDREGARIDTRATGAETDHADIARDQTHQDEHERRRPDQRRDHEQHPVHDISVHPVRPILVAPACPSANANGPTDRAIHWPSPD